MLPGVYRHAGHPDTYRARVRAALEWGGEDALLAGATVLSMAGLEGFAEAPIELYVATGKSANGIKTRRLPTERLPRRSFAGTPGTTIERALLDACSTHPPKDVGRAMDDALRKRLTTIRRLRATIPTDPRGIKGSKVFTRLVRNRDLNDQKVRSEMETRMLKILRRIKGHCFVPDYEVSGPRRYVIDFAFPRELLAVECQSRRWHGPQRATADAARHRALEKLGWTILYFTWDEVEFRPQEVLREIEEFLGRASRARSFPA